MRNFNEADLMFRAGRRLFSIAAILMIVMAAAHTLGFAGNAAKFRQSLAPVGPEIQGAFWALAWGMSIIFSAIGLLNLVVAASDASARLLRALRWTNLVWMVAFTILCLAYTVIPPLILGIVVDVIIVADLILEPRSSS